MVTGPTIGNFIDVAKRATIITVKGSAILVDINRTLSGLEDDSITEAEVWDACGERMEMNRRVLVILTGGSAGL